ncbi:CBF/Mak21 family-domain-containing protein [Obelidium mucronatum]|nr:CBF/Mak21 family-domain-containing protein [Obelidium mucronatum]
MSKDIATIAKEALASKTGFPGIATLLDLMSLEGKKVKNSTVHAASAAATHVFCKLLERGEFRHKGAVSEAEKKVVAWLRDHLDVCLDRLTKLFSSDEPSLQTFGVDCCLKLVRAETFNLIAAQKKPDDWVFENSAYLKFVKALCTKKPANSGTQELVHHVVGLLNSWDDLKLYFYRNLEKVSKADSAQVDISIVFDVISQLDTVDYLTGDNWVTAEGRAVKTSSKKRKRPLSRNGDEETEDEEEEDEEMTIPPQSKSTQKRACSDAWLAYLKVPMNVETYKKILLVVHKTIIPQLNQPTLLIDFLTDSYNAGGAISLLALNGLFTLIQEHNLDYPDFYTKLYTLVDADLLSVKYRSRFFRLLELFLSSNYLPSYLVAAFAKRLSRHALRASPSAIVIVIPFIYNLLKRHPAVITTIHRFDAEDVTDETTDCFIMEENDPAKCRALESSLWELQTMTQHYLPSVSALAGVFQEPLTKAPYEIEDFLDLSYESLFELENKKPVPDDIPMAPVTRDVRGQKFFDGVISFE